MHAAFGRYIMLSAQIFYERGMKAHPNQREYLTPRSVELSPLAMRCRLGVDPGVPQGILEGGVGTGQESQIVWNRYTAKCNQFLSSMSIAESTLIYKPKTRSRLHACVSGLGANGS